MAGSGSHSHDRNYSRTSPEDLALGLVEAKAFDAGGVVLRYGDRSGGGLVKQDT